MRFFIKRTRKTKSPLRRFNIVISYFRFISTALVRVPKFTRTLSTKTISLYKNIYILIVGLNLLNIIKYYLFNIKYDFTNTKAVFILFNKSDYLINIDFNKDLIYVFSPTHY